MGTMSIFFLCMPSLVGDVINKSRCGVGMRLSTYQTNWMISWHKISHNSFHFKSLDLVAYLQLLCNVRSINKIYIHVISQKIGGFPRRRRSDISQHTAEHDRTTSWALIRSSVLRYCYVFRSFWPHLTRLPHKCWTFNKTILMTSSTECILSVLSEIWFTSGRP